MLACGRAVADGGLVIMLGRGVVPTTLPAGVGRCWYCGDGVLPKSGPIEAAGLVDGVV